MELDRLREICSGDKAFERELIQVFLTDTLDRIRAMETALRDKNLEAFRVQAHSVKGASANAGAEQMTSIAGSMEAAGPGGNGRDVSRLLRDLKEEYEQVRLFLTDYLENDLPRADELL